MYLTFYGLKEKPFNTTPDPKFLYLTGGHREALAQLVYGVQESKGFIVLTGEVGTGKTTLIHALLQRLNGQTTVAFVPNSGLPFDGLLEYILEDFGIGERGSSPAQRLFALNNYLIERRRASQSSVLIIDEAQNLEPPTLEQIRLLSNFETPTDKLLQIVLAGQPELEAKLERPELRQLQQRIGLRCRITSLSLKDTAAYIRKRLATAGAPDPGIFSDRAIRRIAKYARGIPRLVNILCDHCLLIGYADQKRQIERDVVDEAIASLAERRRRRRAAAGGRDRRSTTRLRWLMASLATALAGGVAVLVVLHPDALGQLVDLLRSARELIAR